MVQPPLAPYMCITRNSAAEMEQNINRLYESGYRVKHAGIAINTKGQETIMVILRHKSFDHMEHDNRNKPDTST